MPVFCGPPWLLVTVAPRNIYHHGFPAPFDGVHRGREAGKPTSPGPLTYRRGVVKTAPEYV